MFDVFELFSRVTIILYICDDFWDYNVIKCHDMIHYHQKWLKHTQCHDHLNQQISINVIPHVDTYEFIKYTMFDYFEWF